MAQQSDIEMELNTEQQARRYKLELICIAFTAVLLVTNYLQYIDGRNTEQNRIISRIGKECRKMKMINVYHQDYDVLVCPISYKTKI